jgi:hypothetical protein
MTTTPDPSCSMPPSECPPTQPQNGITQCTNMGLSCAYGSTLCLCDACADGPCMVPPVKWQCTKAEGPPSCPATAPNEGTACSTEGEQCTYGFPCSGSGANAECMSGAWVWVVTPCPG